MHQRNLCLVLVGLLLLIGGGRAHAREYHFVDEACFIAIPDSGWSVDTTTEESRSKAVLHAVKVGAGRSVSFFVTKVAISGTFDAHYDFSLFDASFEKGLNHKAKIIGKGLDTIDGVTARSYSLINNVGVKSYCVVVVLGGFEYAVGIHTAHGDPKADPELMEIFHSFTLLGAPELLARDSLSRTGGDDNRRSADNETLHYMKGMDATTRMIFGVVGLGVLLGIGVWIWRGRRKVR